MKVRKAKNLLLVGFAALSRLAAADIALGGTAIVVPEGATPVERSAAAELQDGLRRVYGREFAIVDEKSAPEGDHFLIGATDAVPPRDWRPDEVFIRRTEKGLALTGHPRRGPLYAVDEFLERTLGVRWWTSTEADYPKRTSFAFPGQEADFHHVPPFRFRETYYRDGFDPRFKVRLKGNFTSRTRYMFDRLDTIPPELGGDSRFYFFEGRRSAYHSFFEVLPPAKHLAAHPEWYSLVGGTRQAKQLCLTNDEMAEAYIAETLRLLASDPGADFIQVSQNDGLGACECGNCRAVVEEEGAVSGLYLRFVNRVAEAVERRFPNVTVDTFAYQFTRKPPKLARPRRNVTVRLCDIECGFQRPLAELPANASFLDDLRGWSRIAAGRLYVWDYVTDFSNYMMPHPNFRSLGANVRLFAEAGATGVFEQGDALCAAGEFWPLRQWVLGHLLWDPSADAAKLTDEFLRGYYGPSAAPALRRYLDFLCDTAAKDAKPIRCYHYNVTDFLSLDEVRRLLALMDEAVAAAARDGAPYADRVRREKLSTDHVRLLCWAALGEGGDFGDAVAKWYADGDRFGVKAVRETTLRDFRETYRRELLDGKAGGQLKGHAKGEM